MMPRLLAPRAVALVMAVGAVLGSFDSRASAQVQEVEMPPSEVAARGHYLMGLEHYRAGRFAEAAREFREAYDLSPRPALLYNIFLAHRDAGDTADAVEALRAYLEAEPDAENAELLRARLATLEAQLEAERAREDAPATPEPSAEDGAAEPAGDVVPPAALETEPESGGGASVAPWIVVGSGAALLAGAAVTGGLALATYDDLDASCPDHRCPADFDAESRKSTGSALAITTDVLGAVGIAALGAGIVWAIVDATSGSSSSEERAGVECSVAGCRGRF